MTVTCRKMKLTPKEDEIRKGEKVAFHEPRGAGLRQIPLEICEGVIPPDVFQISVRCNFETVTFCCF